jgi:guanylate kinase
MSRLVILSGPSCVGKGPLHKALRRFYPDLGQRLQKLVLYNTRAARPDEQDGVDYHFRPRQEIMALGRRDGFIVLDVRGDLQGLHVQNLVQMLDGQRDAFFEGNPFISLELVNSPLLAEVAKVSVFLSPLSRDEILYLREPACGVDLPAFVTDIQRRKLLRRTQIQKGLLSLRDLENIERRASSAYREMQLAHHFDAVIPNHDGEGHENWDAFYHPIGDARRTLLAFAALLQGERAHIAEKWEAGLLP